MSEKTDSIKKYVENIWLCSEDVSCKECKGLDRAVYEKDVTLLLSEVDWLNVYVHQLRGALGYPVPGDVPESVEIKNGLAEAAYTENFLLNAEIARLQEERDAYRQALEKIVAISNNASHPGNWTSATLEQIAREALK